MFAEEEWTDGLPAEEQPHAGVRTKIFGGKSKAISKHCLNRTLQTLGSVPTWDSVGPSDGSDEEMEEAPVHVKKKKKKCKKRKKISDVETEGEQHGEVDSPETPVKKRRSKKKLKEPSPNTTSESVRDEKAKDHTEDTTENKLSRQQWRNKMKNKKRCKNKFLQNTAGVAKVSSKEENLGQMQALSKEEKAQVDDLPFGGIKSGEKIDFVLSGSPHAPENDKAIKTKKKKGTNEANHLKPKVLESVCEQPKKANLALQKPTNPHEQCEKQKPVKVDKHSQHQAKKLRYILQGKVTDAVQQKKPTEEKRETADSNNEEKKSPPVPDRSSALRSRMEKRLESARFRYINELLYSSTSGEAKRMFKQDPDAIGIYHKGYTEQVKHWPANPVDSIISYIRQKPATLVVADFGCGDCKIARSVKNKVHCFDLAPVCDLVTACDMANVPLADSTVDIAVFCLSLMGTNLSDFLAEANRVLVDGGVLKIAEVASRFDDLRQFTGALSRLGFKLVNKDTDNTHFYCFEFIKIRNAPANVKKIWLQLNPCLYKKR